MKRKIEDLQKNLPAIHEKILREIEEKTICATSPQPGWEVVVADKDNEGHIFVVLEGLGHRLWACAMIEILTNYVGDFDLLLEADESSLGFPVVVNCWNILVLHEDDMGGQFSSLYLSAETLSTLIELRRAYQKTGKVPEHLKHRTGAPIMDENDFRWEVRREAAEVVEGLIINYHCKK